MCGNLLHIDNTNDTIIDNGRGTLFKDVIEENFPEGKADLNLHIERTHQNSGKKERDRMSIKVHHLVRFLTFKDKVGITWKAK